MPLLANPSVRYRLATWADEVAAAIRAGAPADRPPAPPAELERLFLDEAAVRSGYHALRALGWDLGALVAAFVAERQRARVERARGAGEELSRALYHLYQDAILKTRRSAFRELRRASREPARSAVARAAPAAADGEATAPEVSGPFRAHRFLARHGFDLARAHEEIAAMIVEGLVLGDVDNAAWEALLGARGRGGKAARCIISLAKTRALFVHRVLANGVRRAFERSVGDRAALAWRCFCLGHLRREARGAREAARLAERELGVGATEFRQARDRVTAFALAHLRALSDEGELDFGWGEPAITDAWARAVEAALGRRLLDSMEAAAPTAIAPGPSRADPVVRLVAALREDAVALLGGTPARLATVEEWLRLAPAAPPRAATSPGAASVEGGAPGPIDPALRAVAEAAALLRFRHGRRVPVPASGELELRLAPGETFTLAVGAGETARHLRLLRVGTGPGDDNVLAPLRRSADVAQVLFRAPEYASEERFVLAMFDRPPPDDAELMSRDCEDWLDLGLVALVGGSLRVGDGFD